MNPFTGSTTIKILVSACLLFGGWRSARAQGPTNFAGECQSINGVLLAKDRQGWISLAPRAAVPAETLLVSLFQADLHSKNHAVNIQLLGDVGHHGMFPVQEAGVILHNTPGLDADLSLQRGIIVLTNLKKEGHVNLQVRIRDVKLAIDMKEPGSKLAIEIYGRHAPGMNSLKEDDPVLHLFFVTLKGHVEIESPKHRVGLSAPPGPAVLAWNSIEGQPKVQHLGKLPEELVKSRFDTPFFKELCLCMDCLKEGEPHQHLEKMLKSDKKSARLAAVTSLGAIDDLNGLHKALSQTEHADVRQQGILVLRHWLGRKPGQMETLLKAMKEKGVKDAHAKTVLHLLVGFDHDERLEPETYEVLIDHLNYSQLPVRELAHWHLVRLAPAGRLIPYHAAGSEAERIQAIAAWKKLIPPGQLPPRLSPASKAP